MTWSARLASAWAVIGTLFMAAIAILLFFYPAIVILRSAFDDDLRTRGELSQVPGWFEATSRRYGSWASDYLESARAEAVATEDVAGTEWPLFGSVFYLLTAEELVLKKRIALDAELRETLALAARVVADPRSATWVRDRWGPDYLSRENVFYRMLLMLGLSSYQSTTGDRAHRELVVGQARALLDELSRAPQHLADDYPGECYPSDVVWAVAALERVARLEPAALDANKVRALSTALFQVLDHRSKTRDGLPAFRVEAESGGRLAPARGSGTSGLLILASELDPATAGRWYDAYVTGFFVDNGFWLGFGETARGSLPIMDVDSGPVVLGVGFVASAFGIGAARSLGRNDHAAPLSLEAIALSWPTPFGFLVPSALGKLAADGSCFGELALLFSMTRPSRTKSVVRFSGPVPRIVWLVAGLHLLAGSLLLAREVVHWRGRWRRGHSGAIGLPPPSVESSTSSG